MRIHRQAVVVLVAVLAACGGGVSTVSGADGGGDSDAATGTDGGTGKKNDGGITVEDAATDATREANAPGCPAAYTSSPPGHCTIGLTCAYDEGRCECAGYCGGPAPPPDTDFSHWACSPKLDNGCPDPKPTSGDPCTMPAATCTYGACCTETFVCGQSGKWSSGGLACPP